MKKSDLSKFYCPTCGEKLSVNDLIDKYALGLSCKQKHRFFVWINRSPGTQSSKASQISVDQIGEGAEMIKAWLLKIRLRKHLNDQLAEMLRRIFEIESEKLFIKEHFPFKYCTLCSEPLFHFEQDNAWAQGLRCKNGHEFLNRAGTFFKYRGEYVNMVNEMNDANLVRLIYGWLGDDSRLMQRQLHPQIRRVLEQFVRAHPELK